MYATRLIQVLVAVVSILCMVQATWWDSQKVHHRGLLRRVDILSDLTGGPTSSPPSPDHSSTPPPAESSSTPPPQTSSDTPPPQSSSAPPSSTPTSSGSPTTSGSGGESTSAPPTTSAGHTTSGSSDSSTSTGPSAPPTTSPPASSTSGGGSENDHHTSTTGGGDEDNGGGSTTTPAPIVSTKIEVVTKTNADGSKTTETTTTRTTESASLNADNSKPTGMTTKTRNTIIGVVVGVGGAFIIGALALVAFRVWGRRKHAEEADGLMAYDVDISAAEKSPRGSSSGGPRNPFQSTLENYHQPVNASANF